MHTINDILNKLLTIKDEHERLEVILNLSNDYHKVIFSTSLNIANRKKLISTITEEEAKKLIQETIDNNNTSTNESVIIRANNILNTYYKIEQERKSVKIKYI